MNKRLLEKGRIYNMKWFIHLLIFSGVIAFLVACNNNPKINSNDYKETENTQESTTEHYIPKASDEEIKTYITGQAYSDHFLLYNDDFKETTFIMHSNIGRFNNDSLTSSEPLYAYISMKGTSSATLHLVGKHKGYDWIFFNKAQVKGDDGVFTIFDNVESYDKREDVTANGQVLESYDLHPVNSILIKSFDKLNPEKSYKLRFSGKDYYKEYDIPPTSVYAIQKTIRFYEKIIDILETREIPKASNSRQDSEDYYIDVELIGDSSPAKYINIDNESLGFIISQTWDDDEIYKYSEIGTGDTSSRKLIARFSDDKLILSSNDDSDLTITCYSNGNASYQKNGIVQSYMNSRKFEAINTKETISKDITEGSEEIISTESTDKQTTITNNDIEIVSTYIGQSTASSDKKATVKLINHTGKKIKTIEYMIRAYDNRFGENRETYSETGTYEFSNPLECEKKTQINLDISSRNTHSGYKLEFEVLNYTYAE